MKKLLPFIYVCMSLMGMAQNKYQASPENLQARQWFQDARFGMFIHWGVSSSLAQGEWVMQVKNIKKENYSRLANGFYPHSFDAAKWVGTAKAAGMKYITLITRHHDGFSNWDTKQSDWKITNTPYAKDVVKQMADECHKQGIKLFVYYSLLDWYHPDYQYETGKTGQGTGRIAKSDWNKYIAFMKAQLTELLTNYGEISGVWFDGHWDQLDNDHDKNLKSKVDWHYQEIYELIHKLQPQAMIGNNHHLLPLEGEDFQMFEKDLPGGNSTGFGGQAVSSLPLETCETINGAWGYNITDLNYKSSKELIHYLVKASGFGANFLLNIGPMPDGNIQPEFTERLLSMGDWLKTYGETIYGTKAGFMRPNNEIAVTEKNNKVYLHLLNASNELALKIPFAVLSAKDFKSGKIIKFQKTSVKDYYVFDLTGIELDSIDTVIELDKQ